MHSSIQISAASRLYWLLCYIAICRTLLACLLFGGGMPSYGDGGRSPDKSVLRGFTKKHLSRGEALMTRQAKAHTEEHYVDSWND